MNTLESKAISGALTNTMLDMLKLIHNVRHGTHSTAQLDRAREKIIADLKYAGWSQEEIDQNVEWQETFRCCRCGVSENLRPITSSTDGWNTSFTEHMCPTCLKRTFDN